MGTFSSLAQVIFVRHLAILAQVWATFRLLNICMHSAHKYTNLLMGDIRSRCIKMCAFLFKGTVDIQFIKPSDNVRLEEGDVYQMVESTSYFEAYRHVLKGMQDIHPTMLPFQARVITHV